MRDLPRMLSVGAGHRRGDRTGDAFVICRLGRGDVLVAEVCVVSVGVHARSHPCRFTRYSNGNRKIQTMSTKCQ